MKVTRHWLAQWIDISKISTHDLCERLTHAGLEVDGVSKIAGEFTGVVVGEVLSCEKHPDADRLSVCQVTNGTETLQVVCGAANVRQGLKVAWVQVGGTIGEMNIKKAKLRGMESSGMLCSEKELGLVEDSQGILELPADAPVGTCVREYLQLNDELIDIDLTPNRGDCFSVKGIARELSALFQQPLLSQKSEHHQATIADTVSVTLSAGPCCPRYLACVLQVDNSQASPLWLKENLRRAGIRSINRVVDVLNWVMWDMGQPMHAFDCDTLDGGITVRKARAGESLTLLDESTIKLSDDDLVIADDRGPLALAGVMGGLHSAVSENTKRVVIESAFFAPATIAKTSLRHNIHSDAAQRYARGVDFELPAVALDRVCELLKSLASGACGPVTTQERLDDLPKRDEIALTHEKVCAISGFEIDENTIENTLSRLNVKVAKSGHEWFIKPPSYRFDMAIPEDVVEEILRLHGYDAIPETPLKLEAVSLAPGFDEADLKAFFAARDYHEAITYSFIPKKLEEAFSTARPIELLNPISQDMAVMRSSLWPGLLQAASYNLKRQQQRVRLFEIGRCYAYDGEGFEESLRVGGVIIGARYRENWCDDHSHVDFFDVKGDVESVLSHFGLSSVSVEKTEHANLHPGQSAALCYRDHIVGHLGLLHPSLQKAAGLKVPAYVFELDVAMFRDVASREYAPVSKFPAVRRDLAFEVAQNVSASELVACIQTHSDHRLLDTLVFDVYTGDGVEKGQKSVAIGLIFQDSLKTLTDEDINNMTNTVVDALACEFAASLRDR
ncbi:MAG: phenylalanine--tRNA ligase subunit beta [Gammaproteobacteria bacterium CG11_big_fil_rev_8_21_14_0_20_46_22]|nr:MAG: phenylalanine--tRNA ligase subunit beta [Gammaproteobacteria bacterium CG12_big_fil_rev_8_21_14_0_65_46_12]PIR11569.1 MAG: phenylalanine--tRNA ligase subunit beta [Gammaproteobacteria bacterium CG11_big_fil_rev_8_21_14_0_20_46_22]